MKLKTSTHVIIADSEKFLILRNHGDEGIMDLRVVDAETRENPPTHEQGTDRPGRFPSPNAQYSAVSNVDWHQLEKTQAASDLADRINGLALGKDSFPILLVADAKTLGLVKPLLNVAASNRIVDKISKDLTNHTIPDIEKILAAA